MTAEQSTRWAVTIAGVIFIIAGVRIVQNISGAGGELVPPIIALGGLLAVFGAAITITAWQRRIELRKMLEYELLAACFGVFLICSYVVVWSLTASGPMADLFLGFGSSGIAFTSFVIMSVYREIKSR